MLYMFKGDELEIEVLPGGVLRKVIKKAKELAEYGKKGFTVKFDFNDVPIEVTTETDIDKKMNEYWEQKGLNK